MGSHQRLLDNNKNKKCNCDNSTIIYRVKWMMDYKFFFRKMLVVYILVGLIFANLVESVDDEENYVNLPPIFRIDDYDKCKNEGKLFCKVSVVLTPTGNNFSQSWKQIEHSINNKEAYNHNELYHAICVDDFCPRKDDKNNLHTFLSACYKDYVSNLTLSCDITKLNCTNPKNNYKPSKVDYVWLIAVTIYLFYVFFTTYWDYKKNDSILFSQSFGGQFVCSFSIIKNFRKFVGRRKNPDFQRLRCIQGIRFYNMLLIILCHTYSSYIGGYVNNTEYIESIHNNPLRLALRNLMVFLVQTFFLFSAFLMSYHLFQIIDNCETENDKCRIVWLTFVNRYLRILPPVLIKIGFGSTVWVYRLFRGPIKEVFADSEYVRCRTNWWTSLLFINNHYNHRNMCNVTLWYLAADMQLYVLSLLILATLWSYKKSIKYVLPCLIAVGVWIPSVLSYTHELDIIFRLTPENAKMDNYRSSKFNAIYTSTYSNLATYMLGLCCGYLYFYFKDVDISITKGKKIVWYCIFLGLPSLVVVISSNYYSKLVNALLGGILKPLYALGIAVGVFGISRGLGGLIKRVCEWKYAVLLGNLTYSTYVVQYIIVFYRTAEATRPFFISDLVMMQSFLRDAFYSFLFGLVMHLAVELPAANVQNLLVPQVRCQRVKTDSTKTK